MIARPLVSSDFDRVPMYSSLSVDVLLAQIPNEALFRLFGPELDLITQLKQTIIPSSPWQFRHYVPSCVNHICSFTLEDRANRPRHYGPFRTNLHKTASWEQSVSQNHGVVGQSDISLTTASESFLPHSKAKFVTYVYNVTFQLCNHVRD